MTRAAQSSDWTTSPRFTPALLLCGVALVAAQRMAVPLADLQIPVSAIVILLASLMRLGQEGRLNSRALGMLCALLIATLVAIAARNAFEPRNYGSVSSLGLLVTLYLPALLTGQRGGSRAARSVMTGALIAIEFGAVLAVLQVAVQRFTGIFTDPIMTLPADYLVVGYNSQYGLLNSLTGGVEAYKPNGMIFLEPSFLSMYTSLGLVAWGCTYLSDDRAAYWGRGRSVRMLVLVAGFAVSASATGALVGAVGLCVLLFNFRRRPRVLMMVAVIGAVILVSGWLDLVIAKANEGFSGQTSSALRLTLPYQLVAPIWLERPLLGWGPGAMDDLVRELGVPGLQASTALKLLGEYGLIGALLFIAMIIVALRHSRCPLALTVAILTAWLIPSESLVNATVVGLLLFVVGWWSSESGPHIDAAADTRRVSRRGGYGFAHQTSSDSVGR